MKPFVVFLAMLLSFQVNAQKKGKTDPKDLTIDSLTTVTGVLFFQKDSLTKQLVVYYGVYTSLKENVVKRDFAPDSTSALIGSMMTAQANVLPIVNTAQGDSLLLMKSQNKELAATIEKLNADIKQREADLHNDEAQRGNAISTLRELKSLLDANIISQTEYATLKKKYLAKL